MAMLRRRWSWSMGLHSLTLQLNLSTFGTPSWLNLGHVADEAAQVELTWERVQAPAVELQQRRAARGRGRGTRAAARLKFYLRLRVGVTRVAPLAGLAPLVGCRRITGFPPRAARVQGLTLVHFQLNLSAFFGTVMGQGVRVGVV